MMSKLGVEDNIGFLPTGSFTALDKIVLRLLQTYGTFDLVAKSSILVRLKRGSEIHRGLRSPSNTLRAIEGYLHFIFY